MHSHLSPSEVESLVTRAADEFMDDVNAGKSPSIESYAKKYPQISDVIRQIFPALLVLEDIPASDTPRPDLSGSALDSSGNEPPHSGGRELGDFRILREIGRGGMGVVYEAEQLALGRRVALKVLPFAGMLDQQQLKRFKNEARAAATLDHPHIVAIYSVGSERGIHYYAMQLVEGGSLAQFLATSPTSESPPPSPPDAAGNSEADTRAHHAPLSGTLPDFDSAGYYQTVARLGIEAAQALDHAHAAGILHRDIKPANLLIDTTGKLLVTDFGLARIESDATLTATGDLVGTLRYMSPEQLEGDRGVVDHRSDIYSLGATLYELATRQPLYKGTDRARLMADIERSEPAGPRKLNRRIPVDLETIILKSIEREPGERYATAKALAEDLQRFLERQPIAAQPASLLQRASKWSRRHRTATLVTSVAVVMLLMFSSALMADRWRQVREGSQYVEQSIAAAWEALEQNDVPQARQRLAEASTRIEANNITAPGLTSRVALLKQELDRYGRFLALAATATSGRAESTAAIAPGREALALYGVMKSPNWFADLKRLELPDAHIERIKSTAYEVLLSQADELTRWDHSRTPEAVKTATECLEKAVSFHPPSRGYYWLSANCAFFNDDPATGNALRAKALATPPNHAAELFFINRDHVWGTASPYWGHAMRPSEEIYKAHRAMLRFDPEYFNALYFMGIRFHNVERFEEALVAWYACVSLRPDDFGALLNRAHCHFELDQVEEGAADVERLLDHPHAKDFEGSLLSLLNVYAYTLATSATARHRDPSRALELAQQVCHATEFGKPQYLHTLAAAHAENGHFEQACQWAQKAIDLAPDSRSRNKYQCRLDAYRSGRPWREPHRGVSAGMTLKVAEHMRDNGQYDTAALLFADALPRIAPDSGSTRGRHGEVDRMVVEHDEMYMRVTKLRPNDPSLIRQRLRLFASHGRWSDLLPLFERLAELDPHNEMPWHEGSVVALYIGDMPKYQAICREQLDRLKDSNSPTTCERLVKSCCLIPDPPHVDLLQKIAQRAIDNSTPDSPTDWIQLSAALASYRGRDFHTAIERADYSLACERANSPLNNYGKPYCATAAMVVKAMALHHLGETGAGADLFAQACQREALARPRFEGWFEYYWADWLRLDILKREAEELFATSP